LQFSEKTFHKAVHVGFKAGSWDQNNTLRMADCFCTMAILIVLVPVSASIIAFGILPFEPAFSFVQIAGFGKQECLALKMLMVQRAS
jgi:hypothetical protein